jgi:hypothetical protein
MKRLACFAAASALLAVASPAGADVFELDAQIHTGGMAGVNMTGDVDAFHDRAKGFTFGGLVGVEFLFVDAWVEHNQYYNTEADAGSGINGTWTQFMTGFDLQFDMGERVGDDPQKPGTKGYSKGYGEVGIAIGYGVATGQQVDPPLDRTEVTHQGFLGQVSLDFGHRLNKVLSIGIRIPIQAGYILADSDQNTTAQSEENWYSSLQGAVLVTMRMNFSLTR